MSGAPGGCAVWVRALCIKHPNNLIEVPCAFLIVHTDLVNRRPRHVGLGRHSTRSPGRDPHEGDDNADPRTSGTPRGHAFGDDRGRGLDRDHVLCSPRRPAEVGRRAPAGRARRPGRLRHAGQEEGLRSTRRVMLAFTHNRLFKYGPKGDVVPDLAVSYSHPNATTYVVTLRKGVRFHGKAPVNGRELTAEDVKFTFERVPGLARGAALPHPQARDHAGPLHRAVRALGAVLGVHREPGGDDDVHLREGGRQADGRRRARLHLRRHGDRHGAVHARGVPREAAASSSSATRPTSSPASPYLDGVEVYIIADSSAQLAALRTGKIDLIPVAAGQGLPHSLAAEARAIPGATVIKQSLFQTSENVIGRLDAEALERPPRASRRRRSRSTGRADQGHVPRRRRADLRSRSRSPRATSSRSTSWGRRRAFYRYDPAAARKLLADAGYPARLEDQALHDRRLRARIRLAHRAAEGHAVEDRHRRQHRGAGVPGVDRRARTRATSRAWCTFPTGPSVTRTSGSPPTRPATPATRST